ncbi:hypothetical protein Pla52o_34970 [Novipirellula galeiformis]|uniref:DUF3631 domain-containing protein n=1 Tax=Novipirellula galeiformis TaxID=2528004 RepID=A0A5C6CGN8_9BACT|nr:DUF3631 domain-containing protein [Novipirellula galeiformis]TWU22441.1 hypothetical protein Pla52o_34970 [Novipirellula galeiformis]
MSNDRTPLEDDTDSVAHPAPSTSPTLLDVDEMDASRLVRPELILTSDVSAIAIPRLVERDGLPEGEWLHMVRRGSDRYCEKLTSPLATPSGDVWLSPLPADPIPADVRDWCRWSIGSRRAWLAGATSTTTAETLRLVADWIDRYLVLPDDGVGHGLTLSTWVMMTYVYPALPAVPFLYLAGPPNSGKTRAMDVLSRLVFRPMATSNATAPTLFRTRHAFGGVLLFDEAERLRDTKSPDVGELLSVLLSGYRRGGRASRLEKVGDVFRPVWFDVYGPVVIGCIKGLPPALSSRCLTVRMTRAGKTDPQVSRDIDDRHDAAAVRDALHCWALDHGFNALNQTTPPTGLANRDAELWGPLLRIAADTGDADLVRFMGNHAQAMTVAAADDVTPEADPVFVAALHRLLTETQLPTAGEVLRRAKEIDDEIIDDKWSAKGVAGVLKRYGFRTFKSNGRRVYRLAAEDVATIAERYGFDIDGGDA